MATRNERKRLAKARHAGLVAAVAQAFAVQAAKDKAKADRDAAINAVHEWGRPIKGIGLTRATDKAFVRR